MIYLATPIWRYLDVRVAHAITAAIASNALRERIHWETLDGDALISRSRSQLATKMLEDPLLADADVMVILDDDVQFEVPDLYKIVDGARRTGGLYGGIYVTRDLEPHTAAMGWKGQRIEFRKQEEPLPVAMRYLATGFMAVPRAALERMLTQEYEDIDGHHVLHRATLGVGDQHAWDFFRPFNIRDADRDGQVHALSEDWAFNERARQAGIDIWADMSIFLGHRAMVTITPADLGGTGNAVTAGGAPGKASSVLAVGQDAEEKDVTEQQERVAAGTP